MVVHLAVGLALVLKEIHPREALAAGLAGEAILVPVGADGREVGSHDGSVTALASVSYTHLTLPTIYSV